MAGACAGDGMLARLRRAAAKRIGFSCASFFSHAASPSPSSKTISCSAVNSTADSTDEDQEKLEEPTSTRMVDKIAFRTNYIRLPPPLDQDLLNAMNDAPTNNAVRFWSNGTVKDRWKRWRRLRWCVVEFLQETHVKYVV
ncbi:hypothetical protein GUJ93_ZPchr0002g26754 [Zizania palustris]|uniref:Uncharacterized protein n=1 Tax=Zizania palustris TaxID=103762 RepID=A0A8J5VUU0_ZIZPA|nr:hypothetical protein GUJ93_ZPchr0002g26754 [Zizania palustris]